MILGQPYAIGCGQIGDIGRLLGSKIQWPGKRGFQKTLIAQPGRTTMFGQAFVVQQHERALVDPAPLHSAS